MAGGVIAPASSDYGKREKMGSVIQEDIRASLLKTRKCCRIIGVALFAAVCAVVLLCCILLFAVILNAPASSLSLVAIIAFVVMRGALISAVLWFSSKVFRDAGANLTPFSDHQTIRLRIIAGLLLALMLVEAFFGIDYSSTLDVLGVQFEFAIETMPSLNIPALVLAAVAFCMSVIFQYGALLQEDEDALV